MLPALPISTLLTQLELKGNKSDFHRLGQFHPRSWPLDKRSAAHQPCIQQSEVTTIRTHRQTQQLHSDS